MSDTVSDATNLDATPKSCKWKIHKIAKIFRYCRPGVGDYVCGCWKTAVGAQQRRHHVIFRQLLTFRLCAELSQARFQPGLAFFV